MNEMSDHREAVPWDRAKGESMGTSERAKTTDPTRLISEEAERRLDNYYELARPGEPDSPIEPMGTGDYYLIAILAAALVVLWLIGRFVVLPIYV